MVTKGGIHAPHCPRHNAVGVKAASTVADTEWPEAAPWPGPGPHPPHPPPKPGREKSNAHSANPFSQTHANWPTVLRTMKMCSLKDGGSATCKLGTVLASPLNELRNSCFSEKDGLHTAWCSGFLRAVPLALLWMWAIHAAWQKPVATRQLFTLLASFVAFAVLFK